MAQENNSRPIVQEKDDLIMASHYINPRDIWDLFYGIFRGNKFACAGAMGNMQHESQLYSDNAENAWNRDFGYTDEWLTENINNGTIDLETFLQRSWYVNDVGFGYGLSQWTDSARRTKLWQFTKGNNLDIDSQLGQFNYITWEWTSDESFYHNHYYDYMCQAQNVYQATRYYCDKYEVGEWTEDRYTYALNWYNTFANNSGDYYLSLIVDGNGTVTLSPRMANAGDTITIECFPASGEVLEQLEAKEISSGQSIALIFQTASQTFPMPSDNVQVYVKFSGETPPQPIPQIKKRHMPIWFYPVLRRF